jgi:hypothetical protein
MIQNCYHETYTAHTQITLDNFKHFKYKAGSELDPMFCLAVGMLTVHCLDVQLQGFHGGETVLSAVDAGQFWGWER